MLFCSLVFYSLFFSFAQTLDTSVTDEDTVLTEEGEEGEATTLTNGEEEATALVAEKEVTQIGDVSLKDVGLLPDSFLYPMKTWWEEVRLFFAFSDEKKAELELKFANRRLLELKKLCDEKDKCELAEKLAPKFQNRIERAIQKMEKAKENGKSVDEIIEKLKENQERQQAVLEKVYEKVPEPAKESILEAMEKSAEGLNNAIQNVQGSEEAAQFQNNVRNRVENYGDEVKVKMKERLNFFKDKWPDLNGEEDEEEEEEGDEPESEEDDGLGGEAIQNQAGQN